MTFTYDLATDIGKLRLEVGDTSPETGQGVRPNGSCFTDEELQVFLDREGDVRRAAAAVCEALSIAYARQADLAVGPRRESLSRISDAYARRAREIRAQYSGREVTPAFSGGFARRDGYAEIYDS